MSTLANFFAKISLQEVIKANYKTLFQVGMTEVMAKCFIDVCEMEITSPNEAYDFLKKNDRLVQYIYEPVGEAIRFPLANEKFKVEPIVGPIGTQTSVYHKEDLADHTCLVAANLMKMNAGFIPKSEALKGISNRFLFTTLAVLHDLGKKYTSAVNKKGEMCFYNHAQVSAFIASSWMQNWGLADDAIEIIVASIFYHMAPYQDGAEWSEKATDELHETFGDNENAIADVVALVKAINESDKGISEVPTKEEVKTREKVFISLCRKEG